MVTHWVRHVCAHLAKGTVVALMLASAGFAQTTNQALFDGMRWRQVGPFRGGRAETATGIAGNPLVYYFGAVAGGVWKTINGGASWTPITRSTGNILDRGDHRRSIKSQRHLRRDRRTMSA